MWRCLSAGPSSQKRRKSINTFHAAEKIIEQNPPSGSSSIRRIRELRTGGGDVDRRDAPSALRPGNAVNWIRTLTYPKFSFPHAKKLKDAGGNLPTAHRQRRRRQRRHGGRTFQAKETMCVVRVWCCVGG